MKVDCDIAAVVHVRAGEIRSGGHRFKNLLGDPTRNRSHRRNERLGRIRCNCIRHAFGNHTGGLGSVSPERLPQNREFAAEFVQYRDESLRGSTVGCLNLSRWPECLDNQVDRPVVKIEPPSVW
jgi:hypothetical protein